MGVFSVIHNLLWLHAHQLLCPRDFPGKNTGVGCHFLLQRIFSTQRSNLHLWHCEQIIYHCAIWESPSYRYPSVNVSYGREKGYGLNLKSFVHMKQTFLVRSEMQEIVHLGVSSVQFSSVAQSCPTLCNPMNRSTPGLPVHHQLLSLHVWGLPRTQRTGSSWQPLPIMVTFLFKFLQSIASFCVLPQSERFCIFDGGFNSFTPIIKINHLILIIWAYFIFLIIF